ncbi:IS4 family transposase [Lewinella sp. JB7]|uniref:IS4 family transposase n=1 Tax=Lewinella sp. JB7 TaxID=2962887 RepID=UPI0020C955B0|nr:IS4 family transposase [Lewinella sp. JB7]MCP9237977.1 IS4 family transposase [Lewinella sp. JB7]
MTNALTRFLTLLRSFPDLTEEQRAQYIVDPHRRFTRSSPLTFRRTVAFILQLVRKSTAVELHDFFGYLGLAPVTKSAFAQRRRAIRPAFFRDFFHRSAEGFYTCFKHARRWRSRLLIAVDGTGQTLPREGWIGEAFGFHQNQHDNVPSTRILLTYDLLNRIILRADLHTQKSGEIRHAYPNVERFPQDAIYIYDRGYAGYGLPFLHRRHGSDCIIRLPIDMSPEVRDFVRSGEPDRLITVELKDRAYRTLRDLGQQPVWRQPLELRLVRVELSTGEVEVLLTTLMHRRRFHHRRIGELYGLRWGVETGISHLKSFLQLALTSAYTQPGVEQDLWSTFWFYNVQSACLLDRELVKQARTKDRQYSYRINRNVTAGLIKRWLPTLFLDGVRRWRARTKVLLDELVHHLEPYRPRPSRVRIRRIMRSQDRHVYEPNYRSAL